MPQFIPNNGNRHLRKNRYVVGSVSTDFVYMRLTVIQTNCIIMEFHHVTSALFTLVVKFI